MAFPCPKCEAILKAPEERGGAHGKCPRSGCPVEVPHAVQQPTLDDDEILESLSVDDDDLVDMVLDDEGRANAQAMQLADDVRGKMRQATLWLIGDADTKP